MSLRLSSCVVAVALLELPDVASIPEPEHNATDRECNGAYGQDPVQDISDIEEDNPKNSECSPAQHQNQRGDPRTPKRMALLNQRRRRLSIGLTHAQSLAPRLVLRTVECPLPTPEVSHERNALACGEAHACF